MISIFCWLLTSYQPITIWLHNVWICRCYWNPDSNHLHSWPYWWGLSGVVVQKYLENCSLFTHVFGGERCFPKTNKMIENKGSEAALIVLILITKHLRSLWEFKQPKTITSSLMNSFPCFHYSPVKISSYKAFTCLTRAHKQH